MKLITLYVPQPKLAAIDNLVDLGLYPNRAEAIRTAINDLLRDHDALPKVKINDAMINEIQKPPAALLPHPERRGPTRRKRL